MNLRSKRVFRKTVSKDFADMSVEGKSECEYYNRSSNPVKIILKQASIVDQMTDAIAVTINKRLVTTATVHRKIGGVIGEQKYKDAIHAAKAEFTSDGSRSLSSGSIIKVDLQGVVESPWKCIFLVVEPTRESIEESYKTIFGSCFSLKFATLAMVGVGCGDIGLSPAESSGMAYSALMATDDKKRLSTLKSIVVCDLKSRVIDGFLQQLCQMASLQQMMRPANAAGPLKSQFAMPTKQTGELNVARSYITTMNPTEIPADAECVICLDKASNEEDNEVVALDKCGHMFHFECFLSFLKQCQSHKSCPVCRRHFSVPMGNQPIGSTMREHTIRGMKLPGHEHDSRNTIQIDYDLPSGIQGEEHPRPGVHFSGTRRTAYLPDSVEGLKVLALLKKAFELRLIFTVGDSITTGAQNVVTWTSIHHKTNTSGGAQSFGYPDPTYLARVTAELTEAGVTEELLDGERN